MSKVGRANTKIFQYLFKHIGLVILAGLGSLLISILILPTISGAQASNATSPPQHNNFSTQMFTQSCQISSTVIAGYQLWHGLPNHHQPPPYSSTHPAVISTHIQAAKAWCIDALAPDWYGPPAGLTNDSDRNFIDQATKELLHQSEQQGYKIVLMYDEGTLTGITSVESYTTRVISDLLYAKTNYFTSSAYLQINSQPALFIFPYEQIDPKIDWDKVRQELGLAITLLDKDPNPSDPVHDAQFDGFYAWVRPTNGQWSPDGSNWGEGYLRDEFYATMISPTYASSITVGGVWPGFDDSGAAWGSGRYISRRCGQTWLDTWSLAQNYNPPYVLISTWNDFEEGTDIEFGVVKAMATSNGPTILGQPTILTATMSGCQDATFAWNFDDGHHGSGTVVTHTYTTKGIYDAVVTATNTFTTLTATTVVIVSPTAWQEDFDPLVRSRWVEISAIWIILEPPGSTADLCENNPTESYGKVESEIITVDTDVYPLLRIRLTALDPNSSLTVQILDKNPTNPKPPLDVLHNITSPGEYSVNLADAMGWAGVQNFTINLWVSGEGKCITFDLVSIDKKYSVFLPIILTSTSIIPPDIPPIGPLE